MDRDVTLVGGHPNYHFALLLDQEAHSKQFRLDVKAPNIAQDRFLLQLTAHDHNGHRISESGIADQKVKPFAYREGLQTHRINRRDHVVHRCSYLGGYPPWWPVEVLRIGFDVRDASFPVIK